VLELDSSLPFDPANDADFFSALPAEPAVCLISFDTANAEPLLIRTQDLRRRLQRLLGRHDPARKRLNLRNAAREVRFRTVGSTFEQTLTYYQHARQLFPQRYRDLLRMRPPAILKVSLRNPYPRCYVTRHVPVDASGNPTAGIYYGPFSSRKSAEAFAGGVQDLFKMRRCQIKIRRDPAFPGCIYSEMKMCLAPCFAGCSKEEYDSEVQRFVRFLESKGDSLRSALEAEREQASEELDFERAAALHKKIEKVDEALRAGPELARRIQTLDAMILQRGAGEQQVAAYRVKGGRICEPFFLPFGEIAGQPRSAEQLFRNYLDPQALTSTPALTSTAAPVDCGETSVAAALPVNSAINDLIATNPGFVSSASGKDSLSEHLWLLAKWYYSNPRAGEIFFCDKKGWPYRRILRACSRLLAPPEAAAPPPAESSLPPA
jgi:excinuclease ABC subunit C